MYLIPDHIAASRSLYEGIVGEGGVCVAGENLIYRQFSSEDNRVAGSACQVAKQVLHEAEVFFSGARVRLAEAVRNIVYIWPCIYRELVEGARALLV